MLCEGGAEQKRESPANYKSALSYICCYCSVYMFLEQCLWAIALLLSVAILRGLILKCLAAETPRLALISTVTFNPLSSQQGWKIFQALEAFHVRTTS